MTDRPASSTLQLAPRALVLGLNLFALLVAYYVLKTVREPMLLATGSAELKSYAAAGQALAIGALVPLYGLLGRRVSRRALTAALTACFVGALLLFHGPAVHAVAEADAIEASAEIAEGVHGRAVELVATQPGYDPDAPVADAPAPPGVSAADFVSLGYLFFVFVGVFSVTLVAQVWSIANELHDTVAGERLFPIIVVGANVGAAVGSGVAGGLLGAGVHTATMLLVAAAILTVHGVVNWIVAGWHRAPAQRTAKLDGSGGFAIVLRDRYVLALAGLVLLLNLVNTTGEFILSDLVKGAAIAAVAAGDAPSVGAYIGGFYGGFFSVVNVATIAVQLVVVPILLRLGGVRALVLALPLVALGTYGLVAAGAGFAAFRLAKMAENTTDYSVMNAARAILWLPTSDDAKYKAKQVVDSFVVRFGDVLSALVVFVGLHQLGLGSRGFAGVNVVLVLVWLALALHIARRYRARAVDLTAGT